MSELENKIYRKKRKTKIMIMSVICGLMAAVMLVYSLLFFYTKKTAYVEYSNRGKAIYRAYLAENDFFTEESLNGNHAYVASLIKYMTTDFVYELKLDISAEYRYSYAIDAILEIRDKKTNMAIYNPTYSLVPKTEDVSKAKELNITKNVVFDYNEYNRVAREFMRTYDLNEATAAILVRMTVNVVGLHQTFASDLHDAYVISVSIPLLQPTVTPSVSTTAPTGETKIQTRDDGTLNVMKTIAIASAAVTAVLAAALAIFVVSTRDKKADYECKLKRIVSSYRSYIQRINSDYTDQSCRWLEISDFTELISIRDTLQMPILMYENKECCRTKFFIKNGDMVYYCILQIED